MSVDFRSAIHSGDERHHYYRQATAPDNSDGNLQVGDLWSDTAANILKRCTSLSPVTFVSVEGGSAAHNILSATHGDTDSADTPVDGDVLTWDSANSRWNAEAPPTGSTEFADNVFRVQDDLDATKEIAFQASGITTATTRTITMRDGDVNLAANQTFAEAAHAARHANSGADELAVQDLASDAATDGQVAKADGAGGVAFEDDPVVINFIIDGGGSAITTGVRGFLEIPFAMEIEGWTVLADQSGSIVVDVWKDSYANSPPTVADTIAGTEKPTLSAAQKSQDLTLSSWTTTVTAGDILAFNVDSASTVERVTVALRGRKT